MRKFTQRQKEIYANLKKAIHLINPNLIVEELIFKLSFVEEKNKKHNLVDDMMRLWIYKERNFEIELFNCEQFIRVITATPDKFPLWINIKRIDGYFIELHLSKRFRKFKELHNYESGHPPFKIDIVNVNGNVK